MVKVSPTVQLPPLPLCLLQTSFSCNSDFRSARELGWRTVALYTTEPSLDISHATYADEAIKLDDVSQYMDVAVMVKIALTYVCLWLEAFGLFISSSQEPLHACAPWIWIPE